MLNALIVLLSIAGPATAATTVAQPAQPLQPKAGASTVSDPAPVCDGVISDCSGCTDSVELQRCITISEGG